MAEAQRQVEKRSLSQSESGLCRRCGKSVVLVSFLPEYEDRPACNVVRCEKCGFVDWVRE